MIGITPPDQHVLRFLWWNFETDIETDTSAKTDLTSADRPSPTISGVASPRIQSCYANVFVFID